MIKRITAKYLILSFSFVFAFVQYACSDKNNTKTQISNLFQKYENVKNNEFDSILVLYQEVDSMSRVVEDNQLMYLKNIVHSNLYYRIGELNQSLEKLQIAEKYIEGNSVMDTLKSKLYNSMGVLFMAKCQYDSAAFIFNRSLAISESLGDVKSVQTTLFNQAQLYFDIEDFDNSLKLINEIISKPYNSEIEYMALHLKANIYGVKGKIDSAIFVSKTAINRMDKDKNSSAKSRFLNNLSLCFNAKAQYDSAIYFCNQSYIFDSLQNNKTNMGVNLMLMGEILLSQKQAEKAKIYFDKATEIFDQNKNYDKKRSIFLLLKELAIQKDNFKDAMKFQDSIININKQISNRDVLQTIALTNIKYETDKKNELLKSQNIQLSWKNRMIWFISIFFLVLLGVIYLVYENKTKFEKLKIAKQREKLADLVFEAEQNERIRIARDLHDSVGQKLAVTQMHLSTNQCKVFESNHFLSQMISETILEIRTISQNLLPPDLSQGLFKALENLCEQINFTSDTLKIHFKVQSDSKNLKINRNTEILIYRIIQELTSNSIKHSNAKNIYITFEINKTMYKILYTDDGVGFCDEKLNKSKGVGLKNLIDRVSKLNGLYKFTSEINNGVKYEFEFKITNER